MKPLMAYAITKKKNPKITVYNLYTKEQIEEMRLDKDEKVVKILIKPIK